MLIKYIVTYFLIVVSVTCAFSVQITSLRCLKVLSGGDVELNWQAPDDVCGGFGSYEIYYSTDGSVFSMIQSINTQASSAFVHIGANTATAPVYYFIKTTDDCGVFYSDTLQTIFLNLTNSGNGVAELDWNLIHNPRPVSSSAYFFIYKEYPAGSWNLLDSVPYNSPQYQDTIHACNRFINYRIELGDNLTCTSVSNVEGALYKDGISPDIPVLDSVSVNPQTGNVTMSWKRSHAHDVTGYIIYKEFDGSWIAQDTIWGADSTHFTNYNSSATDYTENYRIAAIDSCLNPSLMSSVHNTIYAFPYYDKCLSQINLKWNAYIGWPDGVAEYKIYLRQSSGSFRYLGAVDGSAVNYLHTDLSDDSTYCYYVRAFSGNRNKSSSSNLACLTTQIVNIPDRLTLDYVSVTGYNEITLSFSFDTVAEISLFKILKSDSASGPYDTIAKLANTLQTPVTYVDYDDIYYDVTYYKIMGANECNIDIKSSNIEHTIPLKVFKTGNLMHSLRWDVYNTSTGNFGKFYVFRKIDKGEFAQIAEEYSGSEGYVDNITALNYTGIEGRFCYYVEAVREDTVAGTKFINRSNISCTSEAPRVFIPTAFTPNNDGTNDVLIPHVAYSSPDDYTFIIFDRWGDEIFVSHTAGEGWNGKYNGGISASGIYVYFIKFSTAENGVFEDTGFFTLYCP